MHSNIIQPLTDPGLALSIYDKVFSARTGYEIVFTSQIPNRGIIFPINNILAGDYLEAFVVATTKIGEDSFYLSMTERVTDSYKPRKGFEREFSGAIRSGMDGSQNTFAENITPVINDWLCLLKGTSALWSDDNPDKHFLNLDYAVYSVYGTWGIWFSNDGYAIIGGQDEFINTFYSAINKTLKEMALGFLGGMQSKQFAMNYLRKLLDVEDAERFIQLYTKNSWDK